MWHHFRYDPDTGILYWKVPTANRNKIGDVVGTPHNKGYRALSFFGERYLVHEIVWYMHYGYWPDNQIDHRDRDKSNNRIANLRDATNSENQLNIDRREDVGVYRRDGCVAEPWEVQFKRLNHRSYHATYEEAVLEAKRVRGKI